MSKRKNGRNDFSNSGPYSTNALLAKELRLLGFRVESIQGLLTLQREGKRSYLMQSQTDFNGQVSVRIAKNKGWLRRVVAEAGINVAQGDTFPMSGKEDARALLKRLSPCVVKPQNGSKARGVTVDVTERTFDAAWDLAARETQMGIVVESYFAPAEEARYLVLDGACIGVYRRLPPHVFGDGKRTVQELVDRANAAKAKNPYRASSRIELTAAQLELMRKQGFGLDVVPDEGAYIAFDQRAASPGRDTINITGEVHPTMLKIAEQVADVLPDLQIFGCDILARDHAKPASKDNYVFLEVNTRPHIRGHQFPDFGPAINVARKVAESHSKRLGFALPQSFNVDLPPPVPAKAAVRSEARSEEVTFVFGGDTCLGGTQSHQSTSGPTADGAGSGYSPGEDLAPLIADKTRLVVNLETVLVDESPEHKARRGKTIHVEMAEDTIPHLCAMGIDGVSLANNHAMDLGPNGLQTTMDRLNAAGITTFGAGANRSGSLQPLTYDTPIGRVHIVAGLEFNRANQTRHEVFSGNGRAGVRPFNSRADNQLAKQIRGLRNRDPDAMIIAFPHWSDARSYRWAAEDAFGINTSLLKAGADLVLGHGPHMVQQCWVDDRDTSVFSLGNFVFNAPGTLLGKGLPPYGLIARLRLRRLEETWATDLRLYPIATDEEEARACPVTEPEAIETYLLLEHHGQRYFRNFFALDRDERGWCLVRTGPLNRNTIELET